MRTVTRDSRTTKTDSTPHGAEARCEPGLVAIYTPVGPASIVLPFTESEIVVGRALLDEYGIDDARLSRQHVRVSASQAGWQFDDLGSRNGSFVDGMRIDGLHTAGAPRVLRAGDTLFAVVADVRPFVASRTEIQGGIVVGPTLRRVFDRVARASSSSPTFHIQGETGVGKEVAARLFHEKSRRSRGSFIAVNCAAIPPPVAERLLFGVRRGAYTGADADADGYLQAADGGTLFLDEIGDLDLGVQAKLLRTLESGEVLPLGAAKARKVDLAILSATAIDLHESVSRRAFRQDLYFRIARPAALIPPVRDRLEEIPWLAQAVLDEMQLDGLGGALRMHASFIEAALCRMWPGNVRELLAETRAAVQMASEENAKSLRASHLAEDAGAAFIDAAPESTGIDRARAKQHAAIVDALALERGNVTAAARRLEMHRTQLRRLLVRYAIDARDVGRSGRGR